MCHNHQATFIQLIYNYKGAMSYFTHTPAKLHYLRPHYLTLYVWVKRTFPKKFIVRRGMLSIINFYCRRILVPYDTTSYCAQTVLKGGEDFYFR